MSNIFGEKLKELREQHFPNESLRRLGQKLEKEGFGEYFYTQLSKMESGGLLPSQNFVMEIVRAYRLSPEETQELLAALMIQRMQQHGFVPTRGSSPQTVGKLFRKTKKNKNP